MQFNCTTVKVVDTYNGKEGCACGCRGTYRKTGPAVKRRVNVVESFVGPMRPDAANFGDAVSYSTDAFMGRRYVYVREGERVTTVYFK